ncbi:MAG: toxin-activating lysine-acyltransferase [Lentibacter algarum]
MGSQIERSLQQGSWASGQHESMEKQISALGWLSFLASFCPLHRSYQGGALAEIFVPAINNDCVRFFKNDAGQICAALIWARLSDDVSERMVFERKPPQASEWTSGKNLWFLDILAPFNHGTLIARHIARQPPDGPFFFARLGPDGQVRKIVRGDASNRKQRVKAYFVDANTSLAEEF